MWLSQLVGFGLVLFTAPVLRSVYSPFQTKDRSPVAAVLEPSLILADNFLQLRENEIKLILQVSPFLYFLVRFVLSLSFTFIKFCRFNTFTS